MRIHIEEGVVIMAWKTRITSLLGIEYPIIQGGLAHLAYSELAAAVSEAGGLGQLTAMTCASPEELTEEIKKIRSLTDKPFGVNFAISQHNTTAYEKFLETAAQAEVPVITITGGNPSPVFDFLKGTNIKKMVLVSSKRQALKAESLGADAVMVVGQEGGGHLGKEDIGTFVLTPSVAASVKIPVIASGGIGDGQGLLAALALGAEGIEMGTRFIATKECVHASPFYKEKLLAMSESDTVIIKRSLGAPARAIRNKWTERILELEESHSTYEDLRDYISGEANVHFAHKGKEEEGYGWAGQIAGRIHDIPTVSELIERMVKDAEDTCGKLNDIINR